MSAKPTGPQRPGMFRTPVRAASGGALVIGALLAYLFFRSAGTGTGDPLPNEGNPDTESTGEPLAVAVGGNADPLIPADSAPNESELTTAEQAALGTGVVTVIIDDFTYLLQIPESDSEPATTSEISLERLVRLATAAEGDSNGIRVRVLKRDTARPSMEYDLKLELKRAGIDEAGIFVSPELAP